MSEILSKLKKHYVLIFFVLMLLIVVFKYLLITRLDNENFLYSYNFFTDDDFDWIANGVRFGSDYISYRNPGLPILVLVLNSFNLLYLLPLINQFLFIGFLSFIYKISVILTGKKFMSLMLIVFLFLNYFLQLFVNYVLADFYAVTFITASILFLLKKKYFLTSVMLVISMLFQNFSYFLYTGLLVYFIFEFELVKIEKKIFRISLSKEKLITFIKMGFIPLILPGLWHLFKLIKFGSPLYTTVQQFGLLDLHTDSVFFYLLGLVGIFGIGFFIGFCGLFELRKKIKKNEYYLILYFLIFTIVFWIFLYQWSDRRFLLYLAPYIIIGLSIMLSKIKKNVLIIPILLLIFYPSYFGNGYLLPQASLYLSNNVSLVFESSTNPKSYALEISPEFELHKAESKSLRSYTPSFLWDYVKNREYYNDINNYSSLSNAEFIDLYNLEEHSLCIPEGKSYSPYILNSLIVINYNRSILLDYEGRELLLTKCE